MSRYFREGREETEERDAWRAAHPEQLRRGPSGKLVNDTRPATAHGMTDPIGSKPRSNGADRAVLNWFSNQMEQKLRANSHKSHWDTVSNAWLLMRLAEEAQELAEALESLDGDARAEDVIRECADVANFALMIADNVRRGEG